MGKPEEPKAKAILPPHLRAHADRDDAELLADHKQRMADERRQRRERQAAEAQRLRSSTPSAASRRARSGRPWQVISPAADANRPLTGPGAGPPEPDLSEYAWDIWRGERY